MMYTVIVPLITSMIGMSLVSLGKYYWFDSREIEVSIGYKIELRTEVVGKEKQRYDYDITIINDGNIRADMPLMIVEVYPPIGAFYSEPPGARIKKIEEILPPNSNRGPRYEISIGKLMPEGEIRIVLTLDHLIPNLPDLWNGKVVHRVLSCKGLQERLMKLCDGNSERWQLNGSRSS